MWVKDTFVEILGWEWLRTKFPHNEVTFCLVSRASGIKSADLCVWDQHGALVGAMECKNLGVSEDEKAWIKSREIKSGPVVATPALDDRAANPFLRKLESTLDTAKEQVKSTGLSDDTFIFMNISLDTPYWGIPKIKAGIQQLVESQTRELKNEGIDLVAFEQYQPEVPFVDG